MTEETTYTFKQILDRLILTDEEILLCKQHREYAEKLDDMFSDHPRYESKVTSTGDLLPPDKLGIRDEHCAKETTKSSPIKTANGKLWGWYQIQQKRQGQK